MKKIITVLCIISTLVLTAALPAVAMTVDKVEVTVEKRPLGVVEVSVYNGEGHPINAELTIDFGSYHLTTWAGQGNVPNGADNKGCLKAYQTWYPPCGTGTGLFGRGTITVRAGNLTGGAGTDKITVSKTVIKIFGFIILR